MAGLEIIIAPDPRLKIKAKPVPTVNKTVSLLLYDMLETMYKANGIGLAGPQVGQDQRVLVIDVACKLKNEDPNPILIVNPEVINLSDEDYIHEEGCLSFPSHYANVTRPNWVEIKYKDQNNQLQKMRAEGLMSVCLQHEMDHLDGILFVDHLSNLKRNTIMRKLIKHKRQMTRN